MQRLRPRLLLLASASLLFFLACGLDVDGTGANEPGQPAASSGTPAPVDSANGGLAASQGVSGVVVPPVDGDASAPPADPAADASTPPILPPLPPAPDAGKGDDGKADGGDGKGPGK